MSLLKKFTHIPGIILSLSTFAAEEKFLELTSFESPFVFESPWATEENPLEPTTSIAAFAGEKGRKRTFEDSLYLDLTDTQKDSEFPLSKALKSSLAERLSVTISIDELITDFTEVFRRLQEAAPFLHTLSLGDESSDLSSLTLPWYDCHIKSEAFKQLFSHAHQLKTLILHSNRFTDPVFKEFIASLPDSLQTLEMHHCIIEDSSESPGDFPTLTNLENLRIFSSSINDNGMKILGASSSNLKEVHLVGLNISKKELYPFISNITSTQTLYIMDTLDIDTPDMDTSDMDTPDMDTPDMDTPDEQLPQEVLERILHFPNLTALFLHNIKLPLPLTTYSPLEKNLDKLKYLSLTFCQLTDKELALFFLYSLLELKYLDVSGNGFTLKGVEKLLASTEIPNLETLLLTENDPYQFTYKDKNQLLKLRPNLDIEVNEDED